MMCDSHENDKYKKGEGDEEMSVKELRENIKSKNQKNKIPHLKTKNGKVVIDKNDPKQVKWFEEFKK